ncbi:outer membrane lipoprotein carrier protein LolA [Geomicrobium sp. JCM 19038]|uniref:LolA family protein n=1 Tax=Geomicrobium sp. JCM 19038 TaxID=1460635 RepID=UPI00045F1CAB|nr:outer membrane lipoprotein carrier protein LolA [Geomicrobium sp. JCM 19038]GAK09788.1 outer membrane lipoprotein receptor [Geomicrobium sp. JCM 19038]
MKKKFGFCTVAFLSIALLAACGEKSEEEVVEDLGETLQTMNGYQTSASLTMQTGQEPREYDVQIAHVQNEENRYYRVELQNENEEQNQMILRNDDGVFLLTPALNKSFRFQSDWPSNNSQMYLYESLVTDILSDSERSFAIEEDKYVFETVTNYQNQNLQQQEIVLNDDLTPHAVRVFDQNYEPLVEVAFHDFELNPAIDSSEFDMDRHLPEEAEAPVSTDEVTEDDVFGVFMPSYEPANTELSETSEVQTDDGIRVIMSYEGEQPFTIIQQPLSMSTSSEVTLTRDMGTGDPIDLGEVIGIQTDNSLTWSVDGVEFVIASDTLHVDEMAAVARSMTATHEK